MKRFPPLRERGGYAAGFLFAAPLLLSLILGVIGLSTLAWRSMSLQQAADAVARQMRMSGAYDACAQAIGLHYLDAYGIPPADVTVTTSPAAGQGPAPYGTPVSVTLTATLPVFLLGLPPDWTVAASATSASDYTPSGGAMTPPARCGAAF